MTGTAPGLISVMTIIENNWCWMRWLAGIIGAIIGFIVHHCYLVSFAERLSMNSNTRSRDISERV